MGINASDGLVTVHCDTRGRSTTGNHNNQQKKNVRRWIEEGKWLVYFSLLYFTEKEKFSATRVVYVITKPYVRFKTRIVNELTNRGQQSLLFYILVI